MTLRQRLLVHVVIPVALVLPLIAGHHSGIPFLQELVAPSFNREFGLVENLQVLLLVLAALTVVRSALQVAGWSARTILFAGAALLVFLVLEELDYGLHYYQALREIPVAQQRGRLNLHNVGRTTQLLKSACDIGLLVAFVVLPFIATRSRSYFLRRLAPSRFYAATVAAMVVLSKLAHFLRDHDIGSPVSMAKNVSEFREIIIYYIVLVYLLEKLPVHGRPTPAENDGT